LPQKLPVIRYINVPIVALSLSEKQNYNKQLFITEAFNIFMSTSTSLFTGCPFDYNLNNFHEYLIQLSLKSGITEDHFSWVKVPGTTPYWKACTSILYLFCLFFSFNFSTISFCSIYHHKKITCSFTIVKTDLKHAFGLHP
jgi:hypothetical protein